MSGDPDTFEFPAWLRQEVIARRGSVVGATPAIPDPGLDVERVLSAQRDTIADQAKLLDRVLANPKSAAELVAVAEASDFGDARTASAQATALAFALMAQAWAWPEEPYRQAVDAWISARGLAFTVDTLIEACRVEFRSPTSMGLPTDPHFVWTDDEGYGMDRRWIMAVRLRTAVATASEDEYTACREAAARHRAANLQARALTTFLFPQNADWCSQDIAAWRSQTKGSESLVSKFLTCAAGSAQQAADLAQGLTWQNSSHDIQTLVTVMHRIGPDVLPLLVRSLDRDYQYGGSFQRVLKLIGRLPTDAAFQCLIDRVDKKHVQQAVFDAAQVYPRRALRLLAESADGDSPRAARIANILRLHALANEDLAREELPELGEAARRRVEELLSAGTAVPVADTAALPPVLVTPPWLSERPPAGPVVVKGLTVRAESTARWREGEREQWSTPAFRLYAEQGEPSWEVIAADVAARRPTRYATGRFICLAPAELVRPLLATWRPPAWAVERWSKVFVGRFDIAALAVLGRLRRAEKAELFQPLVGPDIAAFMAETLQTKVLRQRAVDWLKRHPADAASCLIPVALGDPGKARQNAESALRMLAVVGYAHTVAEAAASYGAEAARAVEGILADDGSANVPKTMPELPIWAEPQVLPQILLRGRTAALPPEAARFVLQMLSISKPDAPFPGLSRVKDFCDAGSLARFARVLFGNWQAADYAPKESWAFDALRWFGDDDAVRALAPLIRIWPGEGGHRRAVAGLDVLAAIGGDVALTHLYGISQKVKFKALKDRAGERIAAIAEELGLSPQQLGDRLVPDLGLDPDGSLVLDFGPRRFSVGFDEQLKPYVRDDAGKRLKTLPKPGAKDDAELAPAAYRRFSALKKDVRALASDQILRLELAMCARRRWSAREFADFFVAHPLLRHIVRRLVWATYGADGAPSAAFRVAEDLTFADIEDEGFKLPDDASVGVAHPLDLGDALSGWSDVFADYEILQPFQQLGRQVFSLTDEERRSPNLQRFADLPVPAGRVVGMERRGWRRGAAWDAGLQPYIGRPLPGGGALIVSLEPGLFAGDVAESGDQSFTDVWISRSGHGDWLMPKDHDVLLSEIDAMTVSEILRDLTEVTTP
jgi:uncharacterized protein DUF4132